MSSRIANRCYRVEWTHQTTFELFHVIELIPDPAGNGVWVRGLFPAEPETPCGGAACKGSEVFRPWTSISQLLYSARPTAPKPESEGSG